MGGIVAFRALPRPQFATLQTAIFPVYFSMQTALPVVVALTASRDGQALGISGLLAPENRYSTLLPMATVAITGLINMFVLRPLTVKTMRERKHQGGPLRDLFDVQTYKIRADSIAQKLVMARRAMMPHLIPRRWWPSTRSLAVFMASRAW